MLNFIRKVLCTFGLHAWMPETWFDSKQGWCHKCRWCGVVALRKVPSGQR
jgi:hypothetical protein